MKRIVTLLIAFFSVVNLYSQLEAVEKTDKKNTIGAHTGFGIGGINAVSGTPNYLSVGIDYSRRLKNVHWSLCTGVEQLGFLGKRFIGDIKLSGDTLFLNSRIKNGPHWDITSIPVQLKYKFRNIAFISFGTALNVFHFKYDTEVSIGWSFGAGFDKEFNNNLTFSLNPYIGESMIFIQAKKGEGRYINLGINFGMGYRF